MREREKNGVRLGQPVRDLDGTSLGKVVRLYDAEFLCRRVLVGRAHVVRYDEVRAVRDGALVVSRSTKDLFELARGEIPHAWRIPTPPAFPTAATPAEARYVEEDVAAGRVPGAALDEEPDRPLAAAPRAPRPPAEEEVREVVAPPGRSVAPPQR